MLRVINLFNLMKIKPVKIVLKYEFTVRPLLGGNGNK